MWLHCKSIAKKLRGRRSQIYVIFLAIRSKIIKFKIRLLPRQNQLHLAYNELFFCIFMREFYSAFAQFTLRNHPRHHNINTTFFEGFKNRFSIQSKEIRFLTYMHGCCVCIKHSKAMKSGWS